MTKFRKKPVVIDAWLFDGSWESARAFVEHNKAIRWGSRGTGGGFVSIETLEGTMIAEPGDYIIRGVKGEYYPCKPDIFAATYDPV